MLHTTLTFATIVGGASRDVGESGKLYYKLWAGDKLLTTFTPTTTITDSQTVAKYGASWSGPHAWSTELFALDVSRPGGVSSVSVICDAAPGTYDGSLTRLELLYLSTSGLLLSSFQVRVRAFTYFISEAVDVAFDMEDADAPSVWYRDVELASPTSTPTSAPSEQPDLIPIGPYKDGSNRALRNGPKKYGYTPLACKAACPGYKYIALQNGRSETTGWCSCDNSLEHATKYGPSNCGPSGGSMCNYIYEVTNP